MAKIEPKTLKGFRDFLPEEQISRQKFIEKIRASYESFGFEPIETPALEYAEVLTGKYGDEGDKLMYRFKDNGDRDVALRYDLTIPLARVVAQYADIKKPFKRYQISPVWRAENTQRGRFREFYQCDADIVGSTSYLADAEILALSSSTLISLGIKDFVIRVNNRRIISLFYESISLSSDDQAKAMRAVDKIDKIGKEGVMEELSRSGFAQDASESILRFASVRIDKIDDLSETLKAFPSVESALKDTVRTIEAALILAPETKFVIDFSIARGLDYYTGIIFETNLSALPQYGSVLSGGRYDGLIGMFSNKPVPAVGASIGLDRLLAALAELGSLGQEKTVIRALVTNFDPSLESECLRMASSLRSAGVNIMMYFEQADLKKQLSYASDKGIRFVVIYGPNEAKEGVVIVKDMESGVQESIALNELSKKLSSSW